MDLSCAGPIDEPQPAARRRMNSAAAKLIDRLGSAQPPMRMAKASPLTAPILRAVENGGNAGRR